MREVRVEAKNANGDLTVNPKLLALSGARAYFRLFDLGDIRSDDGDPFLRRENIHPVPGICIFSRDLKAPDIPFFHGNVKILLQTPSNVLRKHFPNVIPNKIRRFLSNSGGEGPAGKDKYPLAV